MTSPWRARVLTIARLALLLWIGLLAFSGASALLSYPGELRQQRAAQRLAEDGVAVVADDVEVFIRLGRAYYVAKARATFETASGTVTAELGYVRDVDVDDLVWARRGDGFVRGPYDWWEEPTPGSHYRAPLDVLYLPRDPAVAMARRDVERSLPLAAEVPFAAVVVLLPAAVIAAVPSARRWALDGLPAGSPSQAPARTSP